MNKKTAHKKPLLRNIYEHRYIYLFALPSIILVLIFNYYPMYGATLAFKDFKFNLGILGSPWVGFKHFESFLFQSDFWRVFANTIKISGLKLLFCFPAPILLAILLNEVTFLKFKRILQTLSYLPHFVSWVVVATLMIAIFSPYGGIVNDMRKNMGLESIFFLGERDFFYPIVIISEIWKGVGWGTIIYLSAITGISSELYEAAIVDGAGKMRCCWHITVPGLTPTIGIMFILAVGGILNANFDQILLLQQPGNLDISEILDTFVLRTGLTQGRFSYATAIGLFRSLFAVCLMFITNEISKRTLDISIW